MKALASKLLTLIVACWLTAETCQAQPPHSWSLEYLHTRDGRSAGGLLLSRDDDRYEFAEIIRPPGRPVYAVVRSIPAQRVLLYQELTGDARAKLEERFFAIRHRAWIEARQMDDLRLRSVAEANATFSVYDGPWFTLYSTADDITTRRAIVRLEQTLGACRQILPPRVKQVSSFQIYLYGSQREYRAAQQQRQWRVSNPAFYAPGANLVMAGGEWVAFQQELARVTAGNEQTREQWRLAAAAHETKLQHDAEEMKRQGFAGDEIETQIRLMRSTWQEQQKQLEKELVEAEQRNEVRFRTATEAIFRRLQHEAFHAWLENYVYPQEQFAVPRWLNEGLAQVLEHAQLDADTLRIDAPEPALLARFKDDARQAPPLPLRDLLTRDQPLAAESDTTAEARRYYLHAWALTYYLAFRQERLGTPGFERYVLRDALEPVAKFENFVGEDLATFEQRWRADMAKLR
jgi:hypothetical protein